MLLLTSTSDKIQVITGTAVTVDVHAAYMDYSGGTVTPGRTNTAISTATTTDVVASPGASTQRNVKELIIRNKHATAPVSVTVQHTDGTTVVQLTKQAIPPSCTLHYIEDVGFELSSGFIYPTPQYNGKVMSCLGYGDPNVAMRELQGGGHINATPTNISVSIARCSAIRPIADLTVNTIRFYGVGATTDVYHCALYRYSDLARLTNDLTFSTAANTWGTAGTSLGVTLTKDTLYFLAVSVDTTGTTAGVACLGTTTTAAIGQIQSTPGALPGNLDLDAGFQSFYLFQFAVTNGALPNPAATLALPAAWTGGFPLFFLDNA